MCVCTPAPGEAATPCLYSSGTRALRHGAHRTQAQEHTSKAETPTTFTQNNMRIKTQANRAAHQHTPCMRPYQQQLSTAWMSRTAASRPPCTTCLPGSCSMALLAIQLGARCTLCRDGCIQGIQLTPHCLQMRSTPAHNPVSK